MTDRRGYGILFAGLVLVSTSGPFMVASGMPAFWIVVLRMAIAAPIFFTWARLAGFSLDPRPVLRHLLLGSFLLGAHFLLWIKAFELTDYASNLLLLVFQPVSAAFLGALLLGDRITRRTWSSLALAAGGLFIITGGDLSLGPRALVGDLFCLAGDLAIAFFYIATRPARAKLPLPSFMAWTMLFGVVVTLPAPLLARDSLAHVTPSGWGWLLAVALVTTVGGHGLLNLAASRVRYFALNLVIVLEPAIGIAIGALLFPVELRPLQIVGGALLSTAVLVGLKE